MMYRNQRCKPMMLEVKPTKSLSIHQSMNKGLALNRPTRTLNRLLLIWMLKFKFFPKDFLNSPMTSPLKNKSLTPKPLRERIGSRPAMTRRLDTNINQPTERRNSTSSLTPSKSLKPDSPKKPEQVYPT